MIPSTELENGKVELIREILDISDIHMEMHIAFV